MARAAAKLEGKELTKFMAQLNDYLGFFDKVVKRLRNEEVTRAFAEIFAQRGQGSGAACGLRDAGQAEARCASG